MADDRCITVLYPERTVSYGYGMMIQQDTTLESSNENKDLYCIKSGTERASELSVPVYRIFLFLGWDTAIQRRKIDANWSRPMPTDTKFPRENPGVWAAEIAKAEDVVRRAAKRDGIPSEWIEEVLAKIRRGEDWP